MSKEAYPLGASALDELFRASLKYRDRAYAPYSKFRVGAALLGADGQIFGGCNVENASYGAGICAERTAIVKAISEGQNKFLAVAVSSDVPSPTTSPCGICRQFLREFLSPKIPIYFISAEYQSIKSTPTWLETLDDEEAKKYIVKMTMEELLPNSFGPDNLGIKGPQ
ncbi:cytidine deaminase [Kwoniella dendrophila CBS 6074]|uniref:Cytidine deaminase n=1 Tax=Kwoniella dendrophila CBS 6074 TaxID=1295534 RepID=A0AAX4JMV5_9TREE